MSLLAPMSAIEKTIGPKTTAVPTSPFISLAMSRSTKGLIGTAAPDLAVEIVSKGDRSRDKLDFYDSVSTGELLIVDRDPWQLELYRRQESVLTLVGVAKPGELIITIKTLELEAKLLPVSPSDSRPKIHLTHLASQKTWSL